ncbi:MAG: phosphate regulon sensor histidine kinase PhoR [Candidatus Parabeggiatoa sp.]|nr:phosphate regulon sensor histidine kinase PhoR [Candidatus Parabeggiatoa sp.]
MSSAWIQELSRLLGLVLGMLIIGLLVGHTFLFLFLACFIYLCWHLYNLYRLDRWFTHSKTFYPPEAPGIWGEVFYHFYRLQQRNRKRKRKLGAMLKRFRNSTSAMPDAAVILGKNHEIEWLNKAAHQLLGLQSPQDKGKPITNLIRYPSFSQYLTHCDDKTSIKLASPADPNIILRISVIPYARNHQHLLIARDITQIHRLEQIRQDFIANISHELRTPLTVINGFIETMRDAQDDCTSLWERPLLLMDEQTIRMRHIVDDLLLLSRLESEAVTHKKQPIVVADWLKTICEEACVLSGEQNHHITLEADEDLILEGHSEELRSAFSNIVFNAVRYTPAGGDILMLWYEDEKGKHFEVRDTGEGIAPEHLPRLTERFYRVDVGRSRSQGGTGLGLAIVKHVLNRHNGYLRIESTLGEGSIFCCDFPDSQINEQLSMNIEQL